MKKRLLTFIGMALIAGLLLAGCGQGSDTAANANGGDGKQTVVIGYFPNLNHAPAMVAKEKQLFEKALGDNVNVEYKTFPDGSAFMTALETGDIQGGIVGPGPAMNNFITGAKVNVIAAASTGGTVVVTGPDSDIGKPEDLAGKTFITPRIGCTHDVQFETFMKEIGITSEANKGTMKHVTGKPAQYAAMVEEGQVDVAVAPEPWASYMELEVGAKVIIDYDEVAFGTTLPAAVFVTNSDLAKENPELVQSIVDAHQEAVNFINDNPAEAIDITIQSIADITGQELSQEVIEKAWERTEFTYDLDEDAIQAFGDASHDLNFLKEKPDFSGFVDKSFLK